MNPKLIEREPPLDAPLMALYAQLVDVPATSDERERWHQLQRWLHGSPTQAAAGEVRLALRQALRAKPPAVEDVAEVWEWARTFNGCEAFPDRLLSLSREHNAAYEASGRWSGPLEELRACLFYHQRCDRWQGGQPWPQPAAMERRWLDLYQTIRDRWDEIGGTELPTVLDPWCGDGRLLLDAQRLGLTVHGLADDATAVESAEMWLVIPPRFADRPPVCKPVRPWSDGPREGPGAWAGRSGWHFCESAGAAGLAEDLRHYATRIRERWRRGDSLDELLESTAAQIRQHAEAAGFGADARVVRDGGHGARAYSDALRRLLRMAVGEADQLPSDFGLAADGLARHLESLPACGHGHRISLRDVGLDRDRSYLIHTSPPQAVSVGDLEWWIAQHDPLFPMVFYGEGLGEKLRRTGCRITAEWRVGPGQELLTICRSPHRPA